MSYDQLKVWEGEFGNEYHQRNGYSRGDLKDGCFDLAARMSFWHHALSFMPDIKSAHEIGCGTGNNLVAIHKVRPEMDLHGSEPNAGGGFMARLNSGAEIDGDALPVLTAESGSADLVFTYGVLIHLPTDILTLAMSEIVRVSKRYVLAAEYFAPQEEMVSYRERANMLWRRDYGSLFLNNFDLQFKAYGFLWKPVAGLDNVTWWLFEKK